MQVQEIMSTEVATVGPNDDLRMVDDIMAAGYIRHVPVVDESRLVGIVSQRDLLSARMASTTGVGEKAQRSFLHSFLVNDVMIRPVITAPPDTLVSEAAALMIDGGIGCVPVVKEETLVGIVTKTDLLRCLRGTPGVSEEPPAK